MRLWMMRWKSLLQRANSRLAEPELEAAAERDAQERRAAFDRLSEQARRDDRDPLMNRRHAPFQRRPQPGPAAST
jgi:hypothetical protein